MAQKKKSPTKKKVKAEKKVVKKKAYTKKKVEPTKLEVSANKIIDKIEDIQDSMTEDRRRIEDVRDEA